WLLNLSSLKAALQCNFCTKTLNNPTTLPCGHSVCQSHQISPCPSRPRIPPASRVNYLPPPPAPLHAPTRRRPKARYHHKQGSRPAGHPPVRTRPESPGPGRPRKRQRIHDDPPSDDEGDLLSHLMIACVPLPPPPLEKELQSELACEICFMLLYNPVTTPCQHTFCSKCLHRALDHSNLCPLCRDNLPGFSFFEDHPGNQTLETLLATAFPAEYTARGAAIAAEERDARLDTPIFVCMLIFPGHPTALHFFEPRYRLMLRRCLEQDVPSFGMIMPARTGAGAGVTAQTADYGTMLEVRSVQMLADGRSMVETWSTYRFRILERGTLDGYTLMETCTAFLLQLRRGTAPWVVQRLNNVYGAPPADPAAFAYWVALILPIDDARLRLRLVVHWIEQLNNNWSVSLLVALSAS
ncbi:PUA-like domain-containing protein, partial [Mycena metata]